MFKPDSIARFAPSSTGCGTPVSQTPCARFKPFSRSQAMVMARISDCAMLAIR
jgi:hypothetical protein